MEPIRLALVLHFHQPVGNFGEVFREAYDRCYDPLLKVLEELPAIPLTLHFTGPLLEWLEANQRDFLRRLQELQAAGRVEWLSGGFYEPILPALSRADRLGQLHLMRRWLEDHFGASPEGCWLAERVWEPGLASSLAEAGLAYTLLDDHLLHAAGFGPQQVQRSFLVEDGGETLRILPISERLRYLIPFQAPEELIEELARARELGGRVLVYGDDAEKFGLWPGTFAHVFEKGWLEEALQLLLQAREIVTLCTASQALRAAGPPQPAFVPAGSYREMEEWAAPDTQPSLSKFRQGLQADPALRAAAEVYLRGGSWRSFLVRYPEARRMHGRAGGVGRLVREAGQALAAEALRDVFRAQCNCGYWHGLFGGIYLTHLRDAVYRHLLLAESRALQELGETGEASPQRAPLDFDLDGQEETAVIRGPIRGIVKPALGGRLCELSHLRAAWNPLICLARRREAYQEEWNPALFEGEPVGVDQEPRDCLVDRILAAPPDPFTWLARGPGAAADLAAAAYREGWRGDLLLLETAWEQGAGRLWRLEKTLQFTTQGVEAVYRIQTPADAEGFLAVECNLGPGNHGGRSRLEDEGGQGWEIGAPALRPAPRQVRVLAITRGDVLLRQEGATLLLTGPLWSLSRDEQGLRKELQGTCLVFLVPLAAVRGDRFSLKIHLQPWA